MKSRGVLGTAVAVVLSFGAAVAGPDGQVKIGILNDRSGPYSDAGGQGATVMAELAIEDFGKQALGKPVAVVSADHQNKADVGVAIARQWIDIDKVDAIFDTPNSSVMLAVQELVRTKGALLFPSGGGSSSFTGAFCSPYGFQWAYDTFALANGASRALVGDGLKSWYLMQVDYAFGEVAAGDLDKVLTSIGGKIIGRSKTPLNSSDFSSYLLQAQTSGAQVIALLNAGNDTINSVKQAHEFGLTSSGQRLFGMILFETDVIGIGLENAQGLLTTSPFYWAQSTKAEAVSRRYLARMGRVPSWTQIGVYSAVLHYLKAVQAAGMLDRDVVAAKVRQLPVEDAYVEGGKVRADGRMMHDMLLTQVKSPAEAKASPKGEWDVFKVVSTIPAEEAARPFDGSCAVVK